ncbi:outer membrane protein assembly factor BamE [Psychromonas sp. 14N.309.X.WAT.B.A12]|uniref:outer membrane protein assembly factor BamE n=1 Tax=Psychromonas sp. 14N.309.X.WAT.B.A12 TaxID=2998322 RepID=UPI0025B21170|nr:outer membrane protein assembly factor BamE [Psychromonas sp. 14N.309.X.WAT.B.A12]MDN2662015.1 outer membrane protein assembly factor BamE [Psychromonas sp. 14N.309.X.WAT.B.A12]
MTIKKILASLAITFSLSGCSYLYNTFVYQIDVVQGNYVDDKKLAQVELGMTQQQIVFVLGSPMLIDQFDTSKWYYIRYIKPGGEPIQQSQILLTFDGNKLTSITSDNIDQENPLIKNPKVKKEPNEAAQTGDTKVAPTTE